ncbi:hypothetical protein NHX12_007592 [Muraenolepis orangiensis]|uniref:Uncharacterized protein n=1 Tax=Muraenolepis orangiensis TaxID=630683 RepID=A0A9Q0IBQ1_9TELE|nr:hypothetical protein NHX12_007592 [Muraenolepis orangiensis]
MMLHSGHPVLCAGRGYPVLRAGRGHPTQPLPEFRVTVGLVTAAREDLSEIRLFVYRYFEAEVVRVDPGAVE